MLCETKPDNAPNLSGVHHLGYNLDNNNCSKCIKAGYFKMGVANLLDHPSDGFVAPCVLEFELESVEEDD